MEGISYVLKAGVSIDTLYSKAEKDKLSDEQLKALENALKDGKIDENELQTLKGLDINTDKLTNANNSTKNGGTNAAAKKDIAAAVKDLKAKYKASGASGDIYSASNPQLKALQQAMNDGAIAALGEQGYSKNEIVDIVSQAFSVGIKNLGDGKYQVPYGHGAEAKDIYKQFSTELLKAAGDSEEVQASRAKLAQLNNQIRSNERSMQQLEVVIMSLQEKIQENIDKAIEQSKDIEEKHKEETKDAVAKHLDAYTNSNGEMSYEDFQAGLGKELDSIAGETDSALSKTVKIMLQAEKQMSTLTSHLGNMKNLIDLNTKLSADAVAEEANLKELIEAQANSPDADCSPCDPIGFVKEGVRYDFFLDKDGNSDLSNEQEFLGAQNGFSEMMALDTDNSGNVDVNEMSKAGVKVVVTNQDGSQEVKDIKDAFPDGLDVDLKSYQEAGTKMDNGNTLLGTFDVKFGENTIEGYQTLDELDWLDANYDFSDKTEGKGRYAQGEETAYQGADFTEKYTAFSDQANIFRTQMDEIWNKVGVDTESVKNFTADADKKAAQKAEKINADFEEIAKKREEKEAAELKEYEAQKATEEKEAAEADEANADNQNDKDNPFKKKPEETELA